MTKNLLAASLLALACLRAAAIAHASEPDPRDQATSQEQAIVHAVDAETPADIALLQQIININSGTMNLPGVIAVKDVLQPRIEALGFTTRWVPMQSLTARAGDLVAEHPCPAGSGKCGKRLLLIGHMDTVFEPSSSFQKYTIVPGTNGNTATGPGVNDMKGGLVVMLAALDAMKTAGVLQNTEIAIVLSGDEERPGDPIDLARRDMIAAAKHSDIALEFENDSRIDGRDQIRIARRSATTWNIETSGKSGHSSQIFKDPLGYGAIYELTRILDAFRKELPEPGLTFNIGLILGGATAKLDSTGTGGTATGKANIIPPVALANGDIRTLSNDQTDHVEAKMRAIVADHLPHTGATISFSEGYPAMPPTDQSRALVQQLNDINTAFNLPQMQIMDPMLGGAGDIAFVAPYVPTGLVGVGALGEGAHAEGETVFLDSIPLQAKRMGVLMYRLSHP